jgi:hypothetical protein
MAHVPALLAWLAAGCYAIYRALRLAMPGQGALLLALARRRFSSIGRRTKQYLDGGLFGGGLSLLERRLLFAGGLPGLLIYKLQFGLLIDPGCVACGATLARLRRSRGLLGERDVAYWHFSDLCDIRIDSGIRTKADVRHLWVYALAER